MKEYRIEAKIRNNLILKRIEETGCKTVGEFCKKYNFHQSTLGRLINLKEKAVRTMPYKYGTEWKDIVTRLCDIFLCSPEDIITEEQKSMELSNNKRFVEVGMAELEYSEKDKFLLEDKSRPEVSCENRESKDFLEKAFAVLSSRNRKILEMRIMDEMSYVEIGKHFDLTAERIKQIECNSLDGLRRNFGDEIKDYLGMDL